MRRLTGWLALIVILAGLGVLVYEDMKLRSTRMGEPPAVTLGAPAPEAGGAPPQSAAPEAAILRAPAEPSEMEGAAAPAPADMPAADMPRPAVAPAPTMAAPETSPVPAETRTATDSAPAGGEIAVAAASDSSPAEPASTPTPASSSAAGATPPDTAEAAPGAPVVTGDGNAVPAAPEAAPAPDATASGAAVGSSGAGGPPAATAPGSAPAAPGEIVVAAVDPEADADATPPQPDPEPVAPGTDGETVRLAPTFSLVRVEPTGEAVAAGTAPPGASVTLMDGTAAVATAVASAAGDWVIALDAPLPAGPHDLMLRARDGGAAAIDSAQRVAVMVPETAMEQPLVVLHSPDAPSVVLQAPLPSADAAERAPVPPVEAGGTAVPPSPAPDADVAPPDAMATPGPRAEGEPAIEPLIADQPQPPPPAAPVVAVTSVESDSAGYVYVTGTATTLEDVRVYLDDLLLGEATPTLSGTWQLEVPRELPSGTYRVRVDQVEAGAGTVIARAEVPFERAVEVAVLEPVAEAGGGTGAEAAGTLPAPTTLVIKRSDNLWNISRQVYGDGARWTTIYEANKDQIRDPRVIYPGQVFIVPEGNAEWAAEETGSR